MASVSKLIKRMAKIYHTNDVDWMGFRKTEYNKLAFHHIIKDENHGTYDINNGALLTILAHRYLHEIESIDQEIYDKINEVFRRINDSKSSPTNKDIMEIQSYMVEYENKYHQKIEKRISLQNFNMDLIKKVIPNFVLTPTNIRLVMQQGIDPKTKKRTIR